MTDETLEEAMDKIRAGQQAHHDRTGEHAWRDVSTHVDVNVRRLRCALCAAEQVEPWDWTVPGKDRYTMAKAERPETPRERPDVGRPGPGPDLPGERPKPTRPETEPPPTTEPTDPATEATPSEGDAPPA